MFSKIDEHLLAGGTKSLDILVNNAGVGAEGDVETLREADFDRVFNTNVKGLLFVTQNAVPRMVRGGRIINIPSMRSEGRRVGKACVSTGRYRWSPYH